MDDRTQQQIDNGLREALSGRGSRRIAVTQKTLDLARERVPIIAAAEGTSGDDIELEVIPPDLQDQWPLGSVITT